LNFVIKTYNLPQGSAAESTAPPRGCELLIRHEQADFQEKWVGIALEGPACPHIRSVKVKGYSAEGGAGRGEVPEKSVCKHHLARVSGPMMIIGSRVRGRPLHMTPVNSDFEDGFNDPFPDDLM